MMLSHEQVERRAFRILKDASVRRPPVDVHHIAATLGALVREEASGSDISGALFRDGDRVLIGVNVSHPRIRQRFTVAHELGHLCLHDGDVSIDHHYAVVTEGKMRMRPSALRSRISSEATDPREIEANRFAAALLMPLPFLESSLRGHQFPLGEEDIRGLAKTYEVSSQAMGFRLMNLGVPVDLGDAAAPS